MSGGSGSTTVTRRSALGGRWMQAALLLVLWFALWGEVSWANLFSGIVVIALTLVALGTPARTHHVHPIGLARFAATFLWLLISSSWTVAVAVLRPTPERIRTGVVSCPLIQSDPFVATVIADSITLTPGTLSLDVRSEPPAIEVHVLGLGDPDDVRADVARLERLVLRALTPIAGQTGHGSDTAGDSGSGSGGAS